MEAIKHFKKFLIQANYVDIKRNEISNNSLWYIWLHGNI